MKKNKIYYRIIAIGVFLMPFYSIKVSFFNISDLFIITALIMLFYEKLRYNSFFKPFSNKVYALIVFTAFFLMLGGYMLGDLSNQNINTNTFTISFQYVFILAGYLWLFKSLTSTELLKLLKIYLSGFITVILSGVILKTFTPDIYLLLMDQNILIGFRRMGSFTGATGLAKSISVLIILTYFMYSLAYYNIKKVIFMNIIFIIGLIYASSFGGIITSLISYVAILTLFLINNKTKFLQKLLSLVSGLLIIFISFFVLIKLNFQESIFYNRVVKVLFDADYEEAGSAEVKIYLMNAALTIIKENFLFGIGSGNFLAQTIYKQSVHNSYLILWVEGGILPLIGFLILLILFFIMSMKVKGNRKYILLTMGLVLVINSFTNTHFFPRFIFVPYLILIVLLEKNNIANQTQ